jgi:hypothetical protein
MAGAASKATSIVSKRNIRCFFIFANPSQCLGYVTDIVEFSGPRQL